jgi:hypothetical protein
MFEWFALVLVVPLILVPLVLFFGFAGCNQFWGLEETHPAPETTFQTELGADVDHRNRCIVQRIEGAPGGLIKGGSKVTITVQRPSTGQLRLLNLFISRASSHLDPSRDPYDSADDQTPVLSGELLLAADPASPTVELPLINYTLDPTQPLLIAFDIGAEGDLAASTNQVPPFQATAYIGPPPPLPQQPVHEASLSDPDGDRQAGYGDRPRIFLIQRITVS